jgi:hypothetical protein
MIINIPTKADFDESANNLLNLAWDQITALLNEYSQLSDTFYDSEFDEGDKTRYWSAARQTLTTSLTLIQQAVEFFIKGRIVAISPFLLISGTASSWPKGANSTDVSFSSFRSIDAQDLIKVHDTVCAEKFADKFIQFNNEMREQRNKIIHTVDKQVEVHPEKLLESILFVHDYFLVSHKWLQSRKSYSYNQPSNSPRHIRSEGLNEPYILLELLKDMEIIVNNLPPKTVKEYFGFDKKSHALHCPKCYQKASEMDFFDHELLEETFKPYRKVKDKNYDCVICGHHGQLASTRCTEDYCESPHIDYESGLCLNCGCVNTV